jgi:hypothetical protein
MRTIAIVIAGQHPEPLQELVTKLAPMQSIVGGTMVFGHLNQIMAAQELRFQFLDLSRKVEVLESLSKNLQHVGDSLLIIGLSSPNAVIATPKNYSSQVRAIISKKELSVVLEEELPLLHMAGQDSWNSEVSLHKRKRRMYDPYAAQINELIHSGRTHVLARIEAIRQNVQHFEALFSQNKKGVAESPKIAALESYQAATELTCSRVASVRDMVFKGQDDPFWLFFCLDNTAFIPSLFVNIFANAILAEQGITLMITAWKFSFSLTAVLESISIMTISLFVFFMSSQRYPYKCPWFSDIRHSLPSSANFLKQSILIVL